MPTPLVDLLRAHRRQQAAERLRVGVEWEDSGLVFTTKSGRPIDPANYRHYLDRVCKSANLGHWHPHELRHSAASLLASQGVPLKDVSELLGHSSVRITADVYQHLFEPARREIADKMADALWG
jgi:integrase